MGSGAAVPFPTVARSDGVEAIAGELLAAVALLLPGVLLVVGSRRHLRGLGAAWAARLGKTAQGGAHLLGSLVTGRTRERR